MRKLILSALIITAVMAVSCKSPKQEYTDWLYRYMPLPDQMHYGREYWEKNVEKTQTTLALKVLT